jgi:hypothetical protein
MSFTRIRNIWAGGIDHVNEIPVAIGCWLIIGTNYTTLFVRSMRMRMRMRMQTSSISMDTQLPYVVIVTTLSLYLF